MPIRTGKIQIGIAGFLPCEGVIQESITIMVKDPVERPFQFFLSRDDLSLGGLIYLNLDKPFGHQLLPSMKLGPSSLPLPINQRSVTYRVTSGESRRVISFDPSTGFIRPVGAGQALVEAFYNGARAYACVVVVQRDPMVKFDMNRCRDLVPEGALKQ